MVSTYILYKGTRAYAMETSAPSLQAETLSIRAIRLWLTACICPVYADRLSVAGGVHLSRLCGLIACG